MDVRAAILSALTLVLYALHQDVWNWRTAHPLLFGFLPVGLAYPAALPLAAAGWMALPGKPGWPAHLDDDGEPRA